MAKNSSRNLRDQLRDILLALDLPPDPALPSNWVERTFLKGIKDTDLRRLTAREFPVIGKEKILSGKDTHPVFLLERISNVGFVFCPCSSKSYNLSSSFIPAGSRLLPLERGETINKDSYILSQYVFNLADNTDIAGPDNFLGIVFEEAIQGDAYKRRSPR